MTSEVQVTGTGRRAILLGALAIVLAAILMFIGKSLGWWSTDDKAELKLYGNVEIREVQLGFRVGGRLAQLLVDEGDRVVAGQALARLDTNPLRDRLAGADARVAAAEAGVARDAAGSRPQQIKEARAALADAEAALIEARRQHDRRSALLAKGFVSRAEYQSSEAALAAASARTEAVRAGLSLVLEGPRREDRAVNLASRAAIMAERQSVRTDISDSELRAAEKGQVLTRAKEQGAIVQPGETVLTMTLTQPVRVRAYIAEPDLPKVRPGMNAKVSVDGSDKVYTARLGFISPVAEFTPKTVQTEELRADLVYRLRLTVDDPAGELRQGQPVTVRIVPARIRE